ncbi:MAG: ABC transporter ATP-binding protein [Acidimicrobiales bacterium]|nr:ABC transporter ATP-binding protein [Acidimicrobiales bacterium]
MSEPEGREAQSTAALTLRDVGVRVDGRALLQRVDWTVTAAQRWVLLGPNGSGKTTLVRVASLQLHPSSGDVTVLGETLGRTDVRTLRTRIGLVSAAVGARLRPALPALDVVMTARHGALEPWWHRYDDADRERAHALLARFGVAHLASHRTETLSSGERQRVLLARAFMRDPELLLLDEPFTGLDLGAREDLIATIDDLARDATAPPMVLVTHHLEEVPPAMTDALLLRRGEVVAAGAIDATLTDRNLSRCFDRSLVVRRTDRRWSATSAP